MEPITLATTAAFGIALVALWLAGVRLASLTAPGGLSRLLAVVTIVGAAAVAEALILGIVRLGTNPVALLAASLLAFAASRALPAPEVRQRDELGRWWDGLERGWQLGAGAAAGVGVAWALHWLLTPALDIDTTVYHLTQPAIWVQDGRPGSVEVVDLRFPVGNYPLTNEVLISWIAGLSRNMGATLLWGPVAGTMLVLAAIAGCRWAGAGRATTALAAIAMLTVPTVADSVTSLDSDLGAAAWSTIAVALALRAALESSERGLLAYAILASGLAIGTKTSVAVVCLIALGAAAFAMRRRLPPIRGLLAATLAAAVVGGVWYARNLFAHGSPLWPFLPGPWGDPSPPALGEGTRFLFSIRATLDGFEEIYFDAFALAPVILLAAILLPLATRDRRFRLAGAAVAVCVLAWALAPYTGSTGSPLESFRATSTLRYLIPTLAIAAGVLAVLASRRSLTGRLALGVLVATAAWGAIGLLTGREGSTNTWITLAGREGVPPGYFLAAGGAIGALAAGALTTLKVPAIKAAGALAVAAVLIGLAAYPASFLSRYGAEENDPSERFGDTRKYYGELIRWFDSQPAYSDGDAPVIFSTGVIGPLAGGRFEHPIGMALEAGGCEELERQREDGWAVLDETPEGMPSPLASCFAGEEPAAEVEFALGARVDVFGGPPSR